jgi:hypothetical protein
VAKDRLARDGDGRLGEDERAELARLRRENVELAMERDVLKRSVALWVKDAMGPVAMARFIAAQRGRVRHSALGGLSGAGGLAGLVLQVAARGYVAASDSAAGAGRAGRGAVRRPSRQLR